MDYRITIEYSTTNSEIEEDEAVNESIISILENSLPYMVDNVEISVDERGEE